MVSFKTRLLTGLCLGSALVPACAFAASGQLTGLPLLNAGDSSYAYMSNDSGTIVVGQDNDLSSNNHAVIWVNGNLQDLGTLGGASASGYAMSADGSTIVGVSQTSGGETHAFKWTSGGGMVDLGVISGTYSYASAASTDGSVIVGQSEVNSGASGHAFRWTSGGGMADIGTLGGTSSYAAGVSGDGLIVTGAADITGDTASHAFRWTSGGGMSDLGTLGGTGSEANAISNDGTTIVGDAQTAGGDSHAFRWTLGTGTMADLGTLGGATSSAYGVSGNGSVVVGMSDDGIGNSRSFRWTQTTGMQNLETLLSNAGVDMTNITITQANGISVNGKYIAGSAGINGSNDTAVVILYDDSGGGGGGGGGGIGGITTAAAQQQSTQSLAASQQAAAIEGHSTASMLLGGTRPVTSNSYTYAGGMFGSAVGYSGGQWSARGVTLMGGIAYGAQDYPGIAEGNAATFAAAARYMFDDPFGDEGNHLHPYTELGAWVTPNQALTFSRTYMNGAGTSTGRGTTDAIQWAEYGRLGLSADIDTNNEVSGYGEIGQQAMSFGSYAENMDASNPFPASVENGVMRFDVARLGTEWTHKLDEIFGKPLSVTFSGDVARSFAVKSGLHAQVAGVGNFTAASDANIWGEFGMAFETKLTDHIGFDIEMNGTTGGGAIGTAVHGGAGLSYKF